METKKRNMLLTHDKMEQTIVEFELYGRPAFRKERKDPNVKLLDYVRARYPQDYMARYELSKNNFAVVVFESPEYLWRMVEKLYLNGDRKSARFHEILQPLMREAYDIEYKYENMDNEKCAWLKSLDVDTFVMQFIQARNNFLESVSGDWANVLPLRAQDMVVLNSSDADKFSLHLLVPDTYDCIFETTAMKQWQGDFNRWLQETASPFEIDASALGRRDGSFRTVYSTKFGSDRTFIIHSEGASVSTAEYFVNQRENCPFKRATYIAGMIREVAVPPAIQKFVESSARDVEGFLEQTYGNVFRVEQSGDNIWRLRREESSQCLVNTAETHHDNHYCYLDKKGFLWVGCPHCEGRLKARKEPFFIPTREIPEPEVLKSGTHWFDGRISADEYKGLIDAHDIVIDARSTGMGKTFNVHAYARADFEKFMILHHRQSLDEDYGRHYDLASYRDENSGADGISVVINSLHRIIEERFSGNINNIEFLVVDEIRSVLRQTEMAEIEQDVAALFDILQYGQMKLVLMDANITDRDITYLRSKRPNARVAIICDKSRTPEYQMTVFETSPKCALEKLGALLSAHDFEKSKVIIPYSSKTYKMDGFLSNTGRSFININRETRREIDMSAEHLGQYDIIAYSPTLSEGFSFPEQVYADRTDYALFISTPKGEPCAGPESASQMVRRFRKVQQHFAVIGAVDCKPRFTNGEEYLKYAQRNLNVLTKSVNKKWKFDSTVGRSKPEIIQDEFWELHSMIAVENELQRCSYIDTFIQKCVNNKFEVQLGDADDWLLSREDAKIMRQSVRTAVLERYMRMVDLPDITSADEYTRLKSRSETQDDAIRVQKYSLMRFTLIQNPTVPVLSYFGENRRAKQALSHHRDLLQIVNINEFDTKIAALETTIEEQFLERYEELKHQPDFIHQRPYVLTIKPVKYLATARVLRATGWNNLFDTRALNELNIEGLRALLRYNTYREFSFNFGRLPLPPKVIAEKMAHAPDILELIQKEYLDYLEVKIITFRGKWRLVCDMPFLNVAIDDAERNPEYAIVSKCILEKVGADLRENFYIAEKVVQCAYCQARVSMISHDDHVIEMHGDEWLKICPKELRVENKSKVELKCSKCSKTFGHKGHLTRHEAVCGVVKEKKIHKCTHCDYSTKYTTNLKTHLKNKHKTTQE